MSLAWAYAGVMSTYVPNIKVMGSSGTVICYIGQINIRIDTRDLDVLEVKFCMGSAGVEKVEN